MGLSLLRLVRTDWVDRLHREVESFVHWISPSPVEDEIRSLIVTQISNAIQANFPDAKVLPFGSYQTKLYLPLGCVQPFRTWKTSDDPQRH